MPETRDGVPLRHWRTQEEVHADRPSPPRSGGWPPVIIPQHQSLCTSRVPLRLQSIFFDAVVIVTTAALMLQCRTQHDIFGLCGSHCKVLTGVYSLTPAQKMLKQINRTTPRVSNDSEASKGGARCVGPGTFPEPMQAVVASSLT